MKLYLAGEHPVKNGNQAEQVDYGKVRGLLPCTPKMEVKPSNTKNLKRAMKPTEQEVKESIRQIFAYIGEDADREGLVDTPQRIVKMMREIFRGYDPAQKPKITTFDNGKDGLVYDNMVVDKGDYYSLCEHQ